MATLSYAPPSTFSPRYGRLALGTAILFLACLLQFTPRVLLQFFFTPIVAYYWYSHISALLVNLLILAAVPAFATARRTTAHSGFVLCASLAGLHLILAVTIQWVIFGTSMSTPPSPTDILVICTYVFDQLLYVALLIAAIIFLARLRITPLTILTILCFTPKLLEMVHRVVSVPLHFVFNIDSLWNFTAFSLLIGLSDIVLLFFWLTLTILALIFAAKSPQPAHRDI